MTTLATAEKPKTSQIWERQVRLAIRSVCRTPQGVAMDVNSQTCTFQHVINIAVPSASRRGKWVVDVPLHAVHQFQNICFDLIWDFDKITLQIHNRCRLWCQMNSRETSDLRRQREIKTTRVCSMHRFDLCWCSRATHITCSLLTYMSGRVALICENADNGMWSTHRFDSL